MTESIHEIKKRGRKGREAGNTWTHGQDDTNEKSRKRSQKSHDLPETRKENSSNRTHSSDDNPRNNPQDEIPFFPSSQFGFQFLGIGVGVEVRVEHWGSEDLGFVPR